MFVTNEYGANEHIYINNGDGAFETHTTGNSCQ
ncbi:MAG: hypothetical protein KL787_00560 [Taibaiella sp.]|nr:hypothetical protein [Taibaiella sp.]